MARSTLTAGLLACALAAAASAQTVDVVPSLRAGDEFRLQLVHERENSAQPQQNLTLTTPIHVRVLSVTSEGTTIDWQPGTASAGNAAVSNDPLVRATAEAAGNTVLRVSLSSDGEVKGLVNQKEVLEKLQGAVDVVVRGLIDKVPPEQRAALQSTIAGVLSPQVLIASAMRDVQTYFALGGARLNVGKVVEVAVKQPNPFGGEPLPAVLRVTGESATADDIVVLTRTVYDKGALARLTKALLSQPGAPPIPPEELAKMPAIEMVDDARFIIDRRFGIARELNANRGVIIGPQGRRERWTFRLVEPPRR